jgi:hypothetical protein
VLGCKTVPVFDFDFVFEIVSPSQLEPEMQEHVQGMKERWLLTLGVAVEEEDAAGEVPATKKKKWL